MNSTGRVLIPCLLAFPLVVLLVSLLVIAILAAIDDLMHGKPLLALVGAIVVAFAMFAAAVLVETDEVKP